MKTTMLKVWVALLIGTAFVSCGKGGGGGGSTTEATLAVTTNPPANGGVQAAAPGPDFDLSVTITSVMPPKGVTIVISAYVDGSPSSPFFTKTSSSTQAINDFTITGTPAQQTCDVSITVTSNTKSSNTWTGSYRYSMK
jgi:hypothetical protein